MPSTHGVINAAASGSWPLGDRSVHRVGFGTKRLLTPGADGRARAVAVLRRAVELGVNHLDTASFYPTRAESEDSVFGFTALDCANELIHEALAPYPEDLVISTKVGPTESGLARPDQLRGQVEANLRALGRDHLDVVCFRSYGLDSVAEHVGALADLRAAGLVRHLGLSNVRAEHLAQARQIAPVVCVQNRYGVGFGRLNDDLLRACGEQGIAFVPFFALAGSGREQGGVAADGTVQAVAGAHGATAAQVKIAWTLSRGPHVLAIPGSSSPDHVTENVAAGVLRLSDDERDALDAVGEEG